MDAANTKSTMTDAALAALAAAGASLDDKLAVVEFDENSPDDLMDHIDREIGSILSSNAHAVQSRHFLLANNGILGRAQLSARDKTRAQLNTFLEVGDVDTTRTEDYLRKFNELGGYKSQQNSARRVALDDTALLPLQSQSTRGYLSGANFRKRFRRAVTIQSPTFSLTPDNLTPRLPTCESAYAMTALHRGNYESDPETCEDDYDNKYRKLSITDIPPVYLKRDTSHLQNDFYQTVSEMGGGARLSGNESTDESMRDFKASLDLDAVRIRHELEREYREKQTRQLIDSHRPPATQSRVVQEAIAQNSRGAKQSVARAGARQYDVADDRKLNEHKWTGESGLNSRTNANTNANAKTKMKVKMHASTNGHDAHADAQLNEASDVEPSGRGDLMDDRQDEEDESGQERPVESSSSQKRVTLNSTGMSQKGKRLAVQAENARQPSAAADAARTAARGQHRAPQMDAIHQRESNATTSENVTPALSPRETLEKKLLELTEMNLTVRRLQKDKEKIVGELQSIRNHIDQYQTQMRSAERSSNDSRSRADEIRSELRNIERKRDAALGELHSMNAALATKKSALRTVEQRLKKSITEIEALESLGISRDEIETMIEERNRLLEMVQQKEQESDARYELQKQLSKSQEQTRSLERRLITEKIEPLEQELNSKLQQLHDAQSEKDGFRVRVQQLEERLVNQENEYSRIVREKQNEIEAIRLACDKELREIREKVSVDASRMRLECDQRCADVERRLQFEKEQAIAALKRDVQDAKTQMQMRQQESSLQDARRNEELLILRDHFEAEKQMTLKDLETRLLREQNLKISDVEAAFLAQIGDLNRQLSARELELTTLKQHTLEKDEVARQTIERVKAEMQHDFDDALQRERTRMLEENEAAWREEVRALKDEMQRVISALNNQLAQEHEFNDEQRSKIAELESVLLSEREKQRQLSREKLDAINRTRELTRDELEKEYNAQMETLIKKHKEEAMNIRESFRQLERDLDQLRSVRAPSSAQSEAAAADSQRPSASFSRPATGLTWKETLVFVEEVNEECRKTAALLGLRARVVDIDEAHEMHKLGVQTGLHHAVANLKASNQLLRKYAEDVRLAQEDARQKLEFTEEQHAQEIAHLKENHEREFRELRERMREQEQQLYAVRTRVANIERPAVSPVLSGSDRSSSSHDDTLAELRKREDELRNLKAGMEQWKEETASRMGKRLQDEFKAEFDRKIQELKLSLKQKWKKRQAGQRGGTYSSQDDSTGAEDTSRRLDAHSSLRESSRRSRPAQTSLVDMVESSVLVNAAALASGTQDIGLQIKSASMMSASAATELISYLQERVKDLRVENIGLRKRMIDSGLPVPENSAAETISRSSLPFASRNPSPDRHSQLSPIFKTNQQEPDARNYQSRRLNESFTASRSNRVPMDYGSSAVPHSRNLEADVF